MKRYAFSDLVVNNDEVPSKYVEVGDDNGNILGYVECYFVEDEPEEEEKE